MQQLRAMKGNNIMGRLYKASPPCPKCHEEHMVWTVRLTDEEQENMDRYAETVKGKNSLSVLLKGPAIFITREFKCSCGAMFTAKVGLFVDDEVGYSNSDCVPFGETEL